MLVALVLRIARGGVSQDPRPQGRHFNDVSKHRTAGVWKRTVPFISDQAQTKINVRSESPTLAFFRAWWRIQVVFALVFGCQSAWAQQDPAVCISTHADAQLLVRAGRLLEARKRFEACAIADCPKVIQKDCKNLGKAVDKSIPTLRFSLLEPDGKGVNGFQVELDGTPQPLNASEGTLEVDPGQHRLRLMASGFPAAEVSVAVREGEKARSVVVQFAPRDPASRKARSLGQILTGVGVLGVVTFVTFEVSAQLDRDTLGGKATRPETERDYQRVERLHRKNVAADVSLGIGLVSLAAATYLLCVTRNSVAPPANRPLIGFDVRGTKNGVSALISGAF